MPITKQVASLLTEQSGSVIGLVRANKLIKPHQIDVCISVTLVRCTTSYAIVRFSRETYGATKLPQQVIAERGALTRRKYASYLPLPPRVPSRSSRHIVYRGMAMDSVLEGRYARFFDFLNIPWVRSPKQFTFVTPGVVYTPDFYLPTLRIVVEIKGRNPSGKELRKCKALSRALPDDTVVLFYGRFGNPYCGENDYRKFGQDRISSYVFMRGELVPGRAAFGVTPNESGELCAFMYVGDMCSEFLFDLSHATISSAFDVATRHKF